MGLISANSMTEILCSMRSAGIRRHQGIRLIEKSVQTIQELVDVLARSRGSDKWRPGPLCDHVSEKISCSSRAITPGIRGASVRPHDRIGTITLELALADAARM